MLDHTIKILEDDLPPRFVKISEMTDEELILILAPEACVGDRPPNVIERIELELYIRSLGLHSKRVE